MRLKRVQLLSRKPAFFQWVQGLVEEGRTILFLASPEPSLEGEKGWIPGAARYTILFWDPVEIVHGKGVLEKSFWQVLENTFRKETSSGIPFDSLWAGLLSYEWGNELYGLGYSEDNFPLGWWGYFEKMVVWDHLKKEGYLLGEELPSGRQLFPEDTIELVDSLEGEDFQQMVARAREYIREGDIYQVNLSRYFVFKRQRKKNPFLFQRLFSKNPSPFSFYFSWKEWEVMSCSPERLFFVDGDYIETRPIAGTYPPGQEEKFNRDPKEHAEHIMLVDLERNDLGKIARTGTVKVEDLLTIENYSHLIHFVSRITAQLKRDVSIKDIFQSMFPGGTITGCPKKRSMEIIQELEQGPRGLYTGGCGYVAPDGRIDWNIVIRTLVWGDTHGILNVGAGVVSDSDPLREDLETLRKGEVFFEVLGMESEGLLSGTHS